MKGQDAIGRPVLGLAFSACLLAVCALCIGCARNHVSIAASPEDAVWQRDTAPLRAAADSPVGDVPIPAAFHMLEDKSWVRRWGAIRNVHHVYRGSASTSDVADFYLRSMPATTSWRLVSVNESRGEYALLFDNAGEYCFIKITRGPLFGVFKEITLEISPKPQGTFTPPQVASKPESAAPK
jgi:hypothetical protein